MFTTDALRLGSFVMDWYRVAFILGAALFTYLAGRRGGTLERAARWALLAGRVGYLFSYRSGLGGLGIGGLLRALLDLRTGGFAWAWALPPAVLTAGLLARRAAVGLLAPLLGAGQRTKQGLPQDPPRPIRGSPATVGACALVWVRSRKARRSNARSLLGNFWAATQGPTFSLVIPGFLSQERESDGSGEWPARTELGHGSGAAAGHC